jgi:hypothetical protein
MSWFNDTMKRMAFAIAMGFGLLAVVVVLWRKTEVPPVVPAPQLPPVVHIAEKATGPGFDHSAAAASLTAVWDGLSTDYPDSGTAQVVVSTQTMADVLVVATGSWTGTVQFEATADQTNWFAAPVVPIGGGNIVTSATGDGQWVFQVSGAQSFRARCSALSDAGSPPVIALAASSAGGNTGGAGSQVTVNNDGGAPVPTGGAIAPVVYDDGGTSLSGDTGATWKLGNIASVPSGAKAAMFMVSYWGGGTTSQLNYRVRLTHYTSDAGAAAVLRAVGPGNPSGTIVTQTAYYQTVTLADTGSAQVNAPVQVDVTGGVVGVALDLQEAVVSPTDAGVDTISLSWSY